MTLMRSAGTMRFERLHVGVLPVDVRASVFRGASGVAEVHLMVEPTCYADFARQLDWLERAYAMAQTQLGVGSSSAVLRRVFCSDIVNQWPVLAQRQGLLDGAALSCVGQPPAPPAKVGLWAYHVLDPAGPLRKVRDGATLSIDRGELVHHWTTGLICDGVETSRDQTQGIFEAHDAMLEQRGLTLADHVMRTWLFVANIDANYQGMVEARRAFFDTCGLTPATHYIASSGIEARYASVAARVAMDSYAIGGLRPEQVMQVRALAHMSPTHVYGVTFERATAVAYRDRKHLLVSGTASIDEHGRILHTGDVSRQLDRTLENIGALIHEAGGDGLGCMTGLIVYLRDLADHEPVRAQLRERLGDMPMIVVAAPVCRPGWLVEIEGIAVIDRGDGSLPAF